MSKYEPLTKESAEQYVFMSNIGNIEDDLQYYGLSLRGTRTQKEKRLIKYLTKYGWKRRGSDE